MSVSRLSDLAGLHSAKHVLSGVFSHAQGIHALLLYGSEGSGKSTLANMLARSWLCLNPGDEGGCGECQSCRAFERGTAADFQRIEPQPPSFLIRLNAIRAPKKKEEMQTVPLQEFFRTPPLMSRHKVIVIEDCDRMNSDAANSLLKILEEPEPHAKMILTSSRIGVVIPTIRSRCLTVVCERPTEEEIRAASIDDPPFEPLASQPAIREKLESFVQALGQYRTGGALKAAEQLKEICDDVNDAEEGAARTLQAETLHAFGKLVAQRYPERSDWTREIIEAHRRIVGNGNAGLIFDAMFASMLQ